MSTIKKNAHVKLTDEAYALLAEKAEDYNVSQKEIASEAVLMLAKGKDTNKEYRILLDRTNKKNPNNKHSAFGTFVFGVLAGGTLMFIMWVVIG